MRVKSFKKTVRKKKLEKVGQRRKTVTRVHMDLKAESEKLSKAVCGEPELELLAEWFLVQFWPVAVNSLPGSA